MDALTRDHRQLTEGLAVASGIKNSGWRRGLGFSEVPEISAEDAGRNLGRVAATADLTLYAHYDTDHAGHEGSLPVATRALELVDRFLAGLVAEVDPGTTILVASDHGNIEESHDNHTRNPVLGMMIRKAGVPELGDSATSIMDVPALALSLLGAPRG